jgi:hypothetical protein
MRRCSLLGVVALGLLLPACIWQGSVHPFFGEDDYVGVPGLSGVWEEEGSQGASLEFRDDGAGQWELLTRGGPGEPPERFAVRVGRIDGALMWDMTLSSSEEREDGDAEGHLLKLHTCAALRLDGDRLEVRLLDPDWVADELRAGRLDLDHTVVGEGGRSERTVLTASTAQLREFLQAQLAEDGAFGEASAFRRRPAQ